MAPDEALSVRDAEDVSLPLKCPLVALPSDAALPRMLIGLDARFPYLLVVGLFAEDAVLAERRPGQWSAQSEPSWQ